jgi:hypothetical protein
MNVSYKELNQKVSGDLLGVSLSQSAKGKALYVRKSTFSRVPEGAKVRSKAVSFSKLVAGDFVLATVEDAIEVRRFVRLDLVGGNTRLVLADGHGKEVSLPFTRLVGKINQVRMSEKNVDPNPKNILGRAVFCLQHRFFNN